MRFLSIDNVIELHRRTIEKEGGSQVPGVRCLCVVRLLGPQRHHSPLLASRVRRIPWLVPDRFSVPHQARLGGQLDGVQPHESGRLSAPRRRQELHLPG